MTEPASSQAVLDRLEIADLLARYGLAVDSGRWSLLDTVFTPDAILDYTATGGAKGGLREVRAWLSEVLPAFPGRLHLLGPPAIAFDGDHAGVTVAFTDTLAPSREPLGAAAPGLVQGGGYYHHRMERTPVGWRSRELVVEQSWRVFH
ncbi:nuclear transport factor 2 family protein [Actinocorallia sp. API 0066]|uniref:nuclear transport factor 2 family protein n=1 Tax=Actinocorallia sp. API 0066 TaxID=2896846 RepID=UPI001E3971A6|nr:nuclear transport factor 2 family protein [Actinocorallia sp. API 0066]MCD0449951.1 nuclear transport factor 2 family protein [Actinocorallia sp. API 0066]